MRYSWAGLQQSVDVPTLQSMDPYDFEHFIADLWQERGYKCYVRSESNDQAIDIIARKRGIGGKTVAIQVKRHGDDNDLGSPDIQQYHGMAAQVGADESVVVTTGSYTGPARDVADKLGVRLINGRELVTLVRQHASIHFYCQYRVELGIAPAELQREVSTRVSQPVSSFVTSRVNNLSGKLLTALGDITRSFARNVRSIRLATYRSYRRLSGWDPRLSREREDDVPRSEIAATSATLAESLSESGTRRRQPSWVSWHPSDRPLLPTTGIAPSLRDASSAIARRRSWVAGAAAFVAICLLIVSTVGSPSALVGLPQQEWVIQSVSAAAVIGIGLPALFYTQSAVDTAQLVYLVLASWPLVQRGGVSMIVGHVPKLLLVTSGALLSICHPYIRVRLGGGYTRLDLPDVSTQLTPVMSPAVMVGIAGSGLVLVPLVGLSLGSTVLTTSQWSVANNSELIPLLLLGTGCIVLACIYQTLRGGMVGVVSIALAFSTGLGMAALQGVVESVPSIQGILAMVAILTFVSLYVLKQSSNRVLGTQRLFSIVLLVLLFGEYGLYPNLSNLFITPPDTTMQIYVLLSGVAALVLFVAIGWLERRAIARTA